MGADANTPSELGDIQKDRRWQQQSVTGSDSGQTGVSQTVAQKGTIAYNCGMKHATPMP